MRRITRALLLMTLGSAASGCGQFPRDPEGTLERVQESRSVRVGLIASQKARPPAERFFIEQVARATGASPAVEIGPAETVLGRLEEGKLDLVLGEFQATSPWDARETFIPELKKQARGGGQTVVAVAARNGENGWIALLHRHSNLLQRAKS